MHERIIEIIALILAQLRRDNSLQSINLDEISKRGYTPAEISTAYSWLLDRFAHGVTALSEIVNTEKQSFRILHQAERDAFSTEAWGELVEYHALGFLTNELIEEIITRIMISGIQKISGSTLKQLIAMMLLNSTNHAIRSPGAQVMLTGNETIN
ncbi:MAG: DUF494 family protein [Candidatus Kapaibacterium sp.]